MNLAHLKLAAVSCSYVNST